MKVIVTLSTVLTVALAFLGGSNAKAEEGQVSSILYNCNVSFSANGRSVYIGIGYSEIDGKGTISCYDFLTGATQHIPIKVKARGPGAGLGVTGLNLSGGASGIGLTAGPESLLGRYAVVRVNAAVGIGAGASSGLRLSKGAVTLSLNIEAQSGLGAGVDLMFVELSLDREKTAWHSTSKQITASQPAARIASPAVSVQVPAQTTPAQVIYVDEEQPVQLVDSQGRVLKVLILRRRH